MLVSDSWWRPWLLFLNHRKQVISRTVICTEHWAVFQMVEIDWFPFCSSKTFKPKAHSNSFLLLMSLESENCFIQRLWVHSKSSNTGFSCQSQPTSRCCYSEGSGWFWSIPACCSPHHSQPLLPGHKAPTLPSLLLADCARGLLPTSPNHFPLTPSHSPTLNTGLSRAPFRISSLIFSILYMPLSSAMVTPMFMFDSTGHAWAKLLASGEEYSSPWQWFHVGD